MIAALYLFLFVPPILSGVAAYAAWQRRILPGIRALAGISLAAFFWGITYAFEVLSDNPGTKLFWATIKYPAIIWIPILVAVFFLRYSGFRKWPSLGLFAALSIVPLLVLVLVLTNSLHGLFWQQVTQVQYPGYSTQEVVRGPAFYLLLIYAYGLILASGSATLAHFNRLLVVDRNPIWLVAVVMILPPIINLLAIAGLHIFPGLDPTPFTFGLSSILFVLFAHRQTSMLTPVTLAHSTLLEQMREGVIVFDNELRVVEINNAAQRMLNMKRHEAFHQPLDCLGTQAAAIIRKQLERGTVPIETQIDHPNGAHWFELRVTPLKMDGELTAGYMSVWHEITDRKQVESDLRHASTHDQLTGLYNRQYFEERFQHGQYDRHWPITVLMIDLDDLKQINDTLGHSVGDELIRRAAGVIHSALRQGDVVARIGGDEFAAMLGGCSEERAVQVVARLREALANHNCNAPQPPVRFSIGYTVALVEDELRDALKLADARMYEDKSRHKETPTSPRNKATKEGDSSFA